MLKTFSIEVDCDKSSKEYNEIRIFRMKCPTISQKKATSLGFHVILQIALFSFVEVKFFHWKTIKKKNVENVCLTPFVCVFKF